MTVGLHGLRVKGFLRTCEEKGDKIGFSVLFNSGPIIDFRINNGTIYLLQGRSEA